MNVLGVGLGCGIGTGRGRCIAVAGLGGLGTAICFWHAGQSRLSPAMSGGASSDWEQCGQANLMSAISCPAEDVLKDPYVFEFLGIPENKPMMENDLEKALVDHIEKFLLELGRGFMFVGTQQRVTLNNTHYYVDMVFYNKILRSYILIELKTSKLMPEAVGQLNMYLNYYQSEINDEIDNPPIGIILCTDKDNIAAEYALGGLSNQIFASKYTLYIPDKKSLIKEVEAIVEEWHEEQ